MDTPIIFNPSIDAERRAMEKLIAAGARVSDDYVEQLKEYFAVLNPTLLYTKDFAQRFESYLEELKKERPLNLQGRFIYFPWLATISHLLEDEAFQMVRTARNKNLITADEQKAFYNAVIGVAGLSVGNSIALAIVLQGGARHIRLADHDRLSLSNTNRIRCGVADLGLLKVEITARQIYALNPYAQIDIFPEGITAGNIESFFEGAPKLDLIVDEIDNLPMKYLLRTHAKKNKIPVVMGTDNGDNSVVDIERYDTDENLELFHGKLGNVSYEKLLKLTKLETGNLIGEYVGMENVAQRMKDSLAEVGKTLASWPQLGGAALLNGSAVAYCVRKILTKKAIEDRRAFISLDDILRSTSSQGERSHSSLRERTHQEATRPQMKN